MKFNWNYYPFNWDYHPDSRIGRIQFSPLRWGALLVRNIYINILYNLPRSKNDRIVAGIYKESAFLSLYYIDAGRVNGAICEFGSHGYLAPFISRYLQTERSRRSFHVFDSFTGYPYELDKVDDHYMSTSHNKLTFTEIICTIHIDCDYSIYQLYWEQLFILY